MIFFWIFVSIGAAILVWLIFWSLVSFLVNKNDYHKQFIEGTVPPTAPDGFYEGSAHIFFDRQTPWLGKSFVAADRVGYNLFTPQGATMLKILSPLYKRFEAHQDGNTGAYYFQTRAAAGLKDKQTNVIKLDYEAPENPFLIRIILDEIVEIAPEQFLGKIHLKVFPGFYSTIGYFGLKKNVSSEGVEKFQVNK